MEKVKQLQEIKKKQLKKLNASSQDLDSPLASGQNSPGKNCPAILRQINPLSETNRLRF